MSNDFPAATSRTPDLVNLTVIHTEIGAIETQILVDRGLGLRETVLENTLLTSSSVGSVITPINYQTGTTTYADQDTTSIINTGSTFILNNTTITFFAQVDGSAGAPDADTTNVIITSSVTASGQVSGPDPIIGLAGQTMIINLRQVTFTDSGSGNTTQAQAVSDINTILSVTQGITASFETNVITLTKTSEGTDVTEDIDITAGSAIATLNLSVSTATPTGSLIFGGTADRTVNINAAKTLNELIADINTNLATHGVTASAYDRGLLVAASDRFVLRLRKDNNINGNGIDIDATSTALILTELGLTVDFTVITLDDVATQFQTASATTNVSATVIGSNPYQIEFSTNIDSGQIEIDGPVIIEGTTSTSDETGAGFLTVSGTLRFGGTANQDIVYGSAASLLGVVAQINLSTANHGITASSYDTGVVGGTRYHLRLEKSNIINGASILIDAGSTSQVLTDLGLTAGTTDTTFMGFTVIFGAPTFYIDLATDNIFFEDGPNGAITAHGFTTGDQVQVISDGVLPSPLQGFPDSLWYVIDIDDNNMKIAQTNILALAGTPINLAAYGTGSFTLKSLLQSELYFQVWKGLLTDRILKQHMDETIEHFEELGYIIFRSTNETTNTTFNWIVRW